MVFQRCLELGKETESLNPTLINLWMLLTPEGLSTLRVVDRLCVGRAEDSGQSS